MSKPDWGTKRTCQNCGAKYYDLKRSPITCPKCGTVYNPDALLKSRRRSAKPAEAPAPKKAVAASAVTAEAAEEEAPEVKEADDIEDIADGDDEEEVIEDASELGEDDMSDVVIGDDEKEET